MSRKQRWILSENMNAVWAEEQLRDRGGDFSNKQIYVLTKMATGNEEEARHAQSVRAMDELRSGRTPEA